MTTRKKPLSKAWIIVFAILAIGFVATLAGVGSGSSSGSSLDRDAAKSNCHDAVKSQLTAPATAHFHDGTVDTNNDGYGVSGQVDSQNSYGALLTSTYACDTDSSGDVIGAPTLIGN